MSCGRAPCLAQSSSSPSRPKSPHASSPHASSPPRRCPELRCAERRRAVAPSRRRALIHQRPCPECLDLPRAPSRLLEPLTQFPSCLESFPDRCRLELYPSFTEAARAPCTALAPRSCPSAAFTRASSRLPWLHRTEAIRRPEPPTAAFSRASPKRRRASSPPRTSRVRGDQVPPEPSRSGHSTSSTMIDCCPPSWLV